MEDHISENISHSTKKLINQEIKYFEMYDNNRRLEAGKKIYEYLYFLSYFIPYLSEKFGFNKLS